MFYGFLFLTGVLLSLPEAYGQGVPRIVGEIWLGAKPAKGTPEFKVAAARAQRIAWRNQVPKLTFRQVAPPPEATSKVPQVLVSAKRARDVSHGKVSKGEDLNPLFFTVAATWYEGRGTELRIWFDGKKYELRSNFSWEAMEGFPSFEDDHHRFTFLLFTSRGEVGNLEGVQAKLPNLVESGPRFTAAEGTPEEVLDFVDAAHRLYLNDGEHLEEARRKRQANREERSLEQAGIPVDVPQEIELTFWRNETPSSEKGGKK